MMRNLNLNSLREKFKLFDHGLRERQLIHPKRDWSIGLLMTVIILVIAGWWSSKTYMANSNIDVQEDVSTVGSVTYRAGLVAEILEARAKNKQAVEALLSNAIRIEPPVTASSSPETTISTSTATNNLDVIVDTASTSDEVN